jgi:hypothetical protein
MHGFVLLFLPIFASLLFISAPRRFKQKAADYRPAAGWSLPRPMPFSGAAGLPFRQIPAAYFFPCSYLKPVTKTTRAVSPARWTVWHSKQ